VIETVSDRSKWVTTRESIRLITDLGRVGLKFFYKFQYGLIFDPTHPGWTRGESSWLLDSPTRK